MDRFLRVGLPLVLVLVFAVIALFVLNAFEATDLMEAERRAGPHVAESVTRARSADQRSRRCRVSPATSSSGRMLSRRSGCQRCRMYRPGSMSVKAMVVGSWTTA